jgi:hypothetical protein
MFNRLQKIWSRIRGIENIISYPNMTSLKEVTELPEKGKSGIVYLYDNNIYIWDGTSFVCKTNPIEYVKVGEIDYNDFNTAGFITVNVTITDGKPASYYLYRVFFKIAIPFEEDYYYGGGYDINNMSSSLTELANEDNPSSNARDISCSVRLSGNDSVWTAGRIDVYAALIKFPTLA